MSTTPAFELWLHARTMQLTFEIIELMGDPHDLCWRVGFVGRCAWAARVKQIGGRP